MTKDERAALRGKAEKAREAQPLAARLWMSDDSLGSFYNAANPQAVLTLLDALDAAERRAEKARATTLEEAAQVVDCISVAIMDGTHAPNGIPRCVVTTGDCAAAIRALAAKEPDA